MTDAMVESLSSSSTSTAPSFHHGAPVAGKFVSVAGHLGYIWKGNANQDSIHTNDVSYLAMLTI
jgi:hypothetical protein